MSELEFESRKCYICHRFNINPVTPPCDHELCLDCFEQNAEKVSYSCPICRKRNSTWLRLNKKKGLVNTEKEKQIRESFPLEVEKVLNGEEIIFSSEHHLDRVPSEPGEIAKDFELLERKITEEQKRDQEHQEEETARLIAEILAEEGVQINDIVAEEKRVEQEREDQLLAESLANYKTPTKQDRFSPKPKRIRRPICYDENET